MHFKTVIFGFFLSLFSSYALAGGGHNHDHGHSHSHTQVDQATAKSNALDIVKNLVKRNKLDKSWAAVTDGTVEKKTFNGNPEWLAIFVNENISDTDKQTFYVFLTLGGDYIAANFTGK